MIYTDIFSEMAAAELCRQIVNVVHSCHFMGVMDRDLKSDNFLISIKDDKAMVKATNLGLCVFNEKWRIELIEKARSGDDGLCLLSRQRKSYWLKNRAANLWRRVLFVMGGSDEDVLDDILDHDEYHRMDFFIGNAE